MSTHGPPPDSRSPTIEASSPQPMDLDDVDQHLTLSHAVRSRYIKPTDAAAKSLNLMRDEIEGLLEQPWRKNFANTANHLMRLGNKNPKMVKPRRQKLRDIVANNLHIAKLYNECAAKHAESEKRVTYRLPIFADLEPRDESDQGKRQDGDGNSEQQEAGGIVQQDGVEEEERQYEDQGSEQKDVGEGDASQTAGEVHNDSEEMDIQVPLPDPTSQPIHVAEGEVGDFAMEQIEQARDKEMGTAQANLTGHDHESAKTNTAGHEVNGDVEMMSIDVLPRAEAPLTQRRHVHFAPQATLIQEQSRSAVELSKCADIEIQHPQKATKAVQFPAQALQSILPELMHVQATPVINPEAFPIERVQVVQAQYYPSAKIVNILTHREPSGEVVRVTADMQDGPVNHFSIHDARIITALGLRNGDGDTILIDETALKMHETFTITVLPNQRVKNLNNFVVGELKSARHAYLHWLDYRQCADPVCPPFAVEARKIAVQLGRRAHDVWKEIDEYWQLEQGSGGIKYRNSRPENLGEDVRYNAKVKEKRRMPSMWG